MSPLHNTEINVLNTELEDLAAEGKVQRIQVIYGLGGFYVTAAIRGASPEATILITTRRDRSKPRVWKDLTRLSANLRRNFPGVEIELDMSPNAK